MWGWPESGSPKIFSEEPGESPIVSLLGTLDYE